MTDLSSLPLTMIETSLKRFFFENAFSEDTILSAAELSSYLAILMDAHSFEFSSIASEKSPDPLEQSFFLFPKNPTSSNERSMLFSARKFEVQSEANYILSNHDITIGQMQRYMPAHWHTNDYFEIYYAFSKPCPIHFSDEIVVLEPGSALIIAPHVLHASPCYNDHAVLLYYMVRSSTFDEVFWKQLPADSLMAGFFRQAISQKNATSYLHFDSTGDDDIQQLMYGIYNEYLEQSPYHSQMLNALMTTFFLLLLRRYESSVKLPRTEDFYWKKEFSGIFSYIQRNYATASISAVASRFHYSERQITRIIKKCTGINYAQLILQLRMKKAAELLRKNILSIDDIASMVGYSTTSSFYRAFTKYYKRTPGSFEKLPG